MKKCVSLILACMLCLAILGAAEAENHLQDDYKPITDGYEAAKGLLMDEEIDKAVENLAKIIKYYEMKPELKTYLDAQYYYAYALGVTEVYKESPDFKLAEEQLSICPNSDAFYELETYRQYVKGMIEYGQKDYAEAIADLSAINGKAVLRRLTAKITSAIEESKTSYRLSVIHQADDACANGEHEKAQNIYNEYLQTNSTDAEIKELLNICLTKHGPNPVRAIEFTSVVARGESIKLTWKGEADQYTLSWTADLVSGRDAQSKTVEGLTDTVDGLLPGTMYHFTIEADGATASIDKETRKAAEYGDFCTGSSTMYRFDESRYDFLDSGMKSYEFSSDESCKSLKNRTVELFDHPIEESCILFVFTTFGVPEDIQGKPWKLLLHIEGLTTLTDTGSFGDEKVASSGTYIYALVYDLFDLAVENYSDLSDKAFRLDLLVDEKLLASADGVLK